MKPAHLIVLFASVALASCKSAPEMPQTLHPYKVVLMPIEGAKSALLEKPGEADVALSLTSDALEKKIADTVVDSHVFSNVVLAQTKDLKVKGVEDELAAASQIARRTSSDLILRIQVKSARMTDLGNNGNTVWSSLLWFMVPLPIWTVDDRTYDTDIAVQAELYDPDDPVKPTASVVAASGKQELDLWDRGLTPWVIIVPPPFIVGSRETVSETLTERAVNQLLAGLVEELRTREIPSRFEVQVVEESGALRVFVASRRRLRSLEIEVDGKRAHAWAETGLVEDKDSTAERFVYRRSVKLDTKRGAAVRVIAEDEGGGREVRTVIAGGAAAAAGVR